MTIQSKCCKTHEWFDYGIGEVCLKCAILRNVKKIMSPREIKERLSN